MTEEYREKCRNTSIEHFGVTHPMKSPDVIATLKNVFVEHFGVSNPLKNHEIFKKSRQKYWYDGRYFGSFAEIALYIWLKDNKIDFEYQPNVSFSYSCDGKTHTHHPDFRINGQLIEIKGDQFFKEDGTMRCPWKGKDWTDEDKERVDRMYEVKHQCMLQNNVKILRFNDYKKYLDYVRLKYNIYKGHYKDLKISKKK